MTLSVQSVTLTSPEPRAVKFPGRVVEAQAALQGWVGDRSKTVLRPVVSWANDTVTVRLTEFPLSALVEVLVIAQLAEQFSLLTTITVSWNNGDLKVKPEELVVRKPTQIVWQASRKDPCNIVGIFGLPSHEFGRTTSNKADTENARLTWACPDRATTKGRFRYSILAERRDRVAFLDPQIINEPDQA